MKRALLLALCTLAFFGAGKVGPFAASPTTSQYQNPVEQQSGSTPETTVWNRTGCAWDPDDQQSRSGSGYVEPGGTVSMSLCVIADMAGQSHLVTAQYCPARSGDAFAASLSYDLRWSQRGIVTIVPTVGADGCARVCAVGPYLDSGSTYLQPIPDSAFISGGMLGRGQHTDYTLSMTNTGSRRKVFSMFTQMTLDSSATEASCSGTPLITNGICLSFDLDEPGLCWSRP